MELEERGGALVERLAEAMGSRVGAATVYGAPVVANGVTVIPVARARWGFGGGEGRGPDGGGGGGGGGLEGAPVGYIEIRGEGAAFRAIPDPAARAAAAWRWLVGAGLCAWLVLRGVGALSGRRR